MQTRFLIIPDSFKGTLSAREAAKAIAAGVRQALPEAEVLSFPMADGGEGSSEIAGAAIGAERVTLEATNPEGHPVQACYFRKGTHALIELAQASGFSLSANPKQTAAIASSFGTGELIRHAVVHGATDLSLFLGGSATTDGGVGMSRALGALFFDQQGIPLPHRSLGSPHSEGEQLGKIAAIDLTEVKRLLAPCRVEAIVDVDNPLCGPRGAARVYGPQKGLVPHEALELDETLAHLALVAGRCLPSLSIDVSGEPGAGAAGGAGFGVRAFLGGTLRSGSEFFLNLIDFPGLLRPSTVVITGEGRVDEQSLQGKLLGTILSEVQKVRPSLGEIRVVTLAGCSTLAEARRQQYPELEIATLEAFGEESTDKAALKLQELTAVTISSRSKG